MTNSRENTAVTPTLLNGDWFDVVGRIEPHSIDLILTDPPYGILEKCRDTDKAVDLAELETTFAQVLKSTGIAILFCNLDLIRQVLDTVCHFVMRSLHIWQKPSAMPISKLMPLPNAEFILVLKRKGVRTSDTAWYPREMVPPQEPYEKRSRIRHSPTRRMVKSPVNTNSDGKRYVPVILAAPNKPCMERAERSSHHPSQKPEALLRMLIRGYSDKGDLILDPFAGSGSTLISAYKEGRRSIGVELSEEYFLEARERIEKRTTNTDQLTLDY